MRIWMLARTACWLVPGMLCGSTLAGQAAEGDRAKTTGNDDVLPSPEAVARMNPVDDRKAAAALPEVKIPAGFTATIFATPPAVNYPVFLAAAPDGTVYVSSDGNGSLDRKPHRGRVLRVRDRDGDGRADEVRVLVPDVDSPRGLVWDHDRLYLLHPPHISEFIDQDGDGVAESSRVLVKNIAFGFKDRPADHSSNGLELGIDGWLYAAIGDFGFLEAEGTDGRKLQLRGGGVVRVRPDGTGLELYSRGTRNILEVAVSPLLDGFARDNTNDGGGWDIRLHHFTGFDDHGYPRLFQNFTNEMVAPLADYGGGSGCGAAWIEEPGVPEPWNRAAFTADWGRNWVYRHGLTPKGATFAAEQREFVGATRVTDLDVDARSRIYVASWKGATFNWAGQDVGYLIQLRPQGFEPPAVPSFADASESALVKWLTNASHRTRLEAQRALIRRGLNRSAVRDLTALAADTAAPVASRVAALFALKQGLAERANPLLAPLTQDATIAAWAVRALTDRAEQTANVPPRLLEDALHGPDARLRREALAALGRWHGLTGAVADGGGAWTNALRTEHLERHGRAITPLLADPDPVVAHTAYQVLRQLRAFDGALAIVDNASAGPQERSAALRLLGGMPLSTVVDAVRARTAFEREPARRQGLLSTLCRLYFVEGPWNGSSWGTRPDSRGPYYQPEPWSETPQIAGALGQVVTTADRDELAFLVGELQRHRIPLPDAVDRLVSAAEADPAFAPVAIERLARAESLPPAARTFLVRTAAAPSTRPPLRAHALDALIRSGWDDAIVPALTAGCALLSEAATASGPHASPDAERARWRQILERFLDGNQAEKARGLLEAEAALVQGGRSRWADAALIRAAERSRPRRKDAGQTNALVRTIEAAWASSPVRRAQLIEASVVANRKFFAERILAARQDADAVVADAARRATQQLRLTDEPAEGAGSALVGSLSVDQALARVLALHGPPSAGEQVFAKAGCVACHTVRADDPLKGPFLGNIANIYKRRELAEAVLVPNQSIAQGFAAHRFELKNGEEIEGFVVQEAAETVTIRNIAAQELRLRTAEVARRVKLEKSLMPEGLASALTLAEFAALLDYLESLAAAGK